MQKSVNKLMYYPLRDDIPCRRVLKSKARADDNAPSLRGLTMAKPNKLKNNLELNHSEICDMFADNPNMTLAELSATTGKSIKELKAILLSN